MAWQCRFQSRQIVRLESAALYQQPVGEPMGTTNVADTSPQSLCVPFDCERSAEDA
jgi:hypothetical protein